MNLEQEHAMNIIIGYLCNLVSSDMLTQSAELPVGRFGRPEEMADTVVWMVKNAYLTNKVRTSSFSSISLQMLSDR